METIKFTEGVRLTSPLDADSHARLDALSEPCLEVTFTSLETGLSESATLNGWQVMMLGGTPIGDGLHRAFEAMAKKALEA